MSDALDVLVVDDEPLARRSVVRHVAEAWPGARIGEAMDGVDALEKIAAAPPALVFLDVEMPELDGLEVLRQLPAPRPKVVFVTAYAHYAVRAFAENACDYLVKPFTAERIGAAVARARAELASDAQLAALERSLSAGGRHMEQLSFHERGRVRLVPVSEVESLRSEGRHTYVRAGKDEHVSELSLVHFEERLDPERFARVHRSALVSLAHVVEVRLDLEPAVIVLRSGAEVPVSRRGATALRRRLHPPR